MPIRINLLAEQQEAEEARRRDPVKRGIWAGASVLTLTLISCLWLQIKLSGARSTLAAAQASLQNTEAQAKDARADKQRIAEIETRKENLQRYATNRFFSATILDALQRIQVEGVRIVMMETIHGYSTNGESRFKTNLVCPRPSQGISRFWNSTPRTNVITLVSNAVSRITNRVEFASLKVPSITRLTLQTNATQISAAIEIVKPATATEKVVLTIDARDYSEVPGQRVDEFSRAIASASYFKRHLQSAEGQGIRLKERGIRAELDPADPVQPQRPFIPFTIECHFEEAVRANE